MQPVHRLVPDFIIENFRANKSSGVLWAAAMFVDLSGFSTMADALSQHGTHGAEILAEMMRAVFEPLVTSVYSQGGFVIGYAGDAFSAVFPALQDEGQAVMRCLAAAVTMQSHTKSHPTQFTPYGEYPIQIKIGLGYGQTRWQIFKSMDEMRATFWFRGESLSGAVKSESLANPGDIVLSPSIYGMAAERVTGSVIEECYRLEHVLVKLPKPKVPADPGGLMDGLAYVFFPGLITDMSTAGEFRQVVNLFIDIPVNISDEALLVPFMETVYILQEQYGGYFLRPDLGDKGFNLLVVWGAPSAHENDVERAISFVMELSSRTRLHLRAGLSYRKAYAGFIGSSLREDYTAYGWGVNLASRLMESSGAGEYWMDEKTALRAEKHFKIEYINEFDFKGFKERQKTHRLVGRKQAAEIVYSGSLIGRKRELDSLASFMEPLKEGRFAGVLVLKGEAGIGKSRLVHTFQFSEYFLRQPMRWMVCQADEILQFPFNPFKGWLKRRFECIDGQPDQVNWVAFSRNLEEMLSTLQDPQLASELTRTSSLLAGLIDINMPDLLINNLDAKGRYENTLIALSTWIKAEALRSPVVLFLEDAHWLDEASANFMNYFVRSLMAEAERQFPIAVIITQRPEGSSLGMIEEISMTGIRLGKLSTGSMNLLAEQILGHPISESLTRLLENRTDGNPFFAEQILRYLQDQKELDEDEHGKYVIRDNSQVSLPANVGAVLIARLDRLTPGVREIVQTASVLGREFEVRILAEMLQGREDFDQALHEAEKSGIWMPFTDTAYIFKHALLRDAAYSMQLVARQKRLHTLAVSSMESVHIEDLDVHIGELAYHAEKAELKQKALMYLMRAADLAMLNFQNHQAIDYLTRALNLISTDNVGEDFKVRLKRVECNFNLRNIEQQEADLEILNQIALGLNNRHMLAQVYNRRAYLAATLSDHKRVVDFGLQAKREANVAGDDDILLDVNLVVANALVHLGNIEEAMMFAQEGLDLARNMGDGNAQARSLTAMGLVALEARGPAAAYQYQSEALALVDRKSGGILVAKILVNLAGAVGLAEGDYQAANDYFEQAMKIYSEYGDLSNKGHVMANLGWVAGILGDFPKAMDYYEQALVISRQLSSQIDTMFTYVNLSSTASARGLSSNAIEWAQAALEISLKLEDAIGEAWAHYAMGVAELSQSNFREGIPAFMKSLEIRLRLNAGALIHETRAGLVNAYLEAGDVDAAKEQAELILQYMEINPAFEGAEEPLRVHLALFNYLNERKDSRIQQVLRNAKTLLDTQVSNLRLEQARARFVENVPWRRGISEAIQQNDFE